MTMRLRPPFVAAGLFAGFQLYSLITMLPGTVSTLGIGGIDLLLLGGLIVLGATQMELGKRLSHIPPATAQRDSMIFAAIGYFIFVNSPIPFWLTLGFLGWSLSLAALQIASMRLILLTPEPERRPAAVNSALIGLVAGLLAAKTMTFIGLSQAWMTGTGIGASLVLILITHFHCRQNAGYPMPGQMWFLRDLLRDTQALSMIGTALAGGLMLGTLVAEQAYLGPAVLGVGLATLFGSMIFRLLSTERALRYAICLAAGALVLDTLIWDRLAIFSACFLAGSAALVFSGICLNSYAPESVMPTAERIGLYNLGMIAGFIIISALHLPALGFSQRYWSVSAALLLISFLTSFSHPARE